jgi:hypothetical protein
VAVDFGLSEACPDNGRLDRLLSPQLHRHRFRKRRRLTIHFRLRVGNVIGIEPDVKVSRAEAVDAARKLAESHAVAIEKSM